MSRLVPALALVATTGCLSRPELATNDGGSGDASFDPGLLRNGDFELGCAMWYGADANVVVDQPDEHEARADRHHRRRHE